MSIPVDLAKLADTLSDYGLGYLLTTTDDQRSHAVAVRPRLDGGALHVDGLGKRTRANLEARPGVTLLWPPKQEGGYSLIVDGRASLGEDAAAVTPERAVLHRPADVPPEPGATGCVADCVTI